MLFWEEEFHGDEKFPGISHAKTQGDVASFPGRYGLGMLLWSGNEVWVPSLCAIGGAVCLCL